MASAKKKSDDEVEPTADPEDRLEGGALGRDPDALDDAGLDDDDDDGALEDVPATAEGKASAIRLIDLLLEKKALALHVAKPSTALVEAVARALEWPGPVNRRANKLSDAIVDSDDVDELFVDDDGPADACWPPRADRMQWSRAGSRAGEWSLFRWC